MNKSILLISNGTLIEFVVLLLFMAMIVVVRGLIVKRLLEKPV